ncbi:ATP-dependent DNA helicase II subunit 1 [Tilletia horrida]|nr:ATP-dependent DNA helicase II subunit 1 [Tilletia horrida]KAK0560450.1 ATP-dependent DNA helicase II subunit 1 [Tilletia horrida]
MSRSWRNAGKAGDDGEDSDGGAGGDVGDRRELMNWDQLQLGSTKDIVLFCIDAGPHMHQINPDTGVSYLHSALFAACQVQEAKLVNSPFDLVGILLFGTNNTDMQDHISRGTAYKHCHMLQPIDQVDVTSIAGIYDLLSLDAQGLCRLDIVSQCQPYPKLFRIEHALGNAVHYLMAQGKTGYKRIFFITNNDDPTVERDDVTKPAKTKSKKETEVQKKCLRYVNEAGVRNIELEPLFISSSQHEFNVDTFYAEVFAAYDDPMKSDSDPSDSSDSDEDSDLDDDSDAESELLEQLGIISPTAGKKKSKAQKLAAKANRKAREEQRETRNRRLYDCACKITELNNVLEERQMPKRVIFNSVMEVVEGIHVGVKGYAMFARATRGTPVRMVQNGDAWEEVGAITVAVCEDTGETLRPKEDIETAFSFGAGAAAASYNAMRLAEGFPGGGGDGVSRSTDAAEAGPSRDRDQMATSPEAEDRAGLGSIPGTAGRGLAKFDKNEIREMREMGVHRGIRILGFKPQSKLEFWMNRKHAVFLYPTDETWPGSKRFFASLLGSMAKKKVFGLALCLPRTGMTPFFAAIWPREEEISSEGVQLAAPGMFMIPLPFADDMRDKPYEATVQARDEEIEAAKKIIKRYSYPNAFKPDTYPNPALALHYATIRAVAFERELPKTSTIAKAKAQAHEAVKKKKRLEAGGEDAMDVDASEAAVGASALSSLSQLGSVLGLARNPEEIEDKTRPDYAYFNSSEEKSPLIKHFNELIEQAGYGNVKGAPPKFKKKDEAMLREKWESDGLSKLKVTELKAALSFYKLPVTGVKAELVERLNNALDSRWGDSS